MSPSLDEMISLISAPYHLGRHGVGMGAGPARMVSAGAVDMLEAQGHRVEVAQVDPARPFEHEIGAHFAVQAALAQHVRQAVDAGRFPFILGGNCSSVLGAVAGVGLAERGGVVWFDAHGDANTPETTQSGFLDGMPVAVLTDRCWTRLATQIPGFVPLPDAHVLLAGLRSIDEDERLLIDSSAMALAGPDELSSERFDPLLAALAHRIDSVHIHIDLDVIDLSDGRANEFATDGGPPLAALESAIRSIAAYCPIDSVSVTSYNPSSDDGHALEASLRLLQALGEITPRAQHERDGAVR